MVGAPIRAFLDERIVVSLGDMGVHSLGTRDTSSLSIDRRCVYVRLVHACELFSHSQRFSYARNQWSVSVQDRLLPIAVYPDLTKGQGGRNGREEELVLRVFPLLCLCAGRRFRKLVRIYMPVEVAVASYSGKLADRV